MKIKLKFEYRITLIYLFCGLVWILLSDFLLESVVTDKSLINFFQSVKGSFFILITAILLYFISRQHTLHQRTAEEKLRDSNAKYKALFHENKAIIVLTKYNGDIVDANNAALDFYGYNHNEIRKLKITDIKLFPDPDTEDKKQQSGIEWQNFNHFKHRLSNGDVRYVQEYNGTITLREKSLHYFLIHDISKQVEAENQLIEAKEKAEESDRLKSAFLANMSHEIRTPMNGINGFIKLLENRDLENDKYTLYLNLLKKSSERLLGTINDIIEISKIESNQVVFNSTEFDVNETVNYLYALFKPEIEEKGLVFRLENSLSGKTIIFRTDKNKLESIFFNLLKNAVKFTHKGYIEFGFTTEKESFIFYVKDTGTGIPKEKQKSVFERFIQADIEITRPYEGAGLGLSIAKAYAQMLGGEIKLESAEGKGSTFYFLINDPTIVVKQEKTVSLFLKNLSIFEK